MPLCCSIWKMFTDIAAVLWDMDGTLIDSEPAWIQAQTAIVANFGGTWTKDDGLALVGSSMEETVRALQSKGVAMDDQDLLRDLEGHVLATFRRGISWRPGALRLIESINAAGVPQAIVTTSRRILVEPVLERLQNHGVRLAITGDDVERGKPDPEPYLRAADILNVDITACVAIEDSPTGIRSAIAAGAVTIGVPHDRHPERSHHFVLWPSLLGRSAEDVLSLYTTRKSPGA